MYKSLSTLALTGLISALLVTNASAGVLPGSMGTRVYSDRNGNQVETVEPSASTYIPNIAAASRTDRALAQKLLNGVNRFCANHTAAGLKLHNWRPGTAHPGIQTHYFNPDPHSQGLRPGNPRAALVYGGQIGGVMFNGSPRFAYFGSIPRAHIHGMMMQGSMVEMLHVYCTGNLQHAFTPNRMLGVRAVQIALRLKIRPAIMDLTRHQLRVVVTKVRTYTGNVAQTVTSVGPSTSGPIPYLRAMRVEIREALMVLTRHQLRVIWNLMQSF
jgi:hypothetical protein